MKTEMGSRQDNEVLQPRKQLKQGEGKVVESEVSALKLMAVFTLD